MKPPSMTAPSLTGRAQAATPFQTPSRGEAGGSLANSGAEFESRLGEVLGAGSRGNPAAGAATETDQPSGQQTGQDGTAPAYGENAGLGALVDAAPGTAATTAGRPSALEESVSQFWAASQGVSGQLPAALAGLPGESLAAADDADAAGEVVVESSSLLPVTGKPTDQALPAGTTTGLSAGPTFGVPLAGVAMHPAAALGSAAPGSAALGGAAVANANVPAGPVPLSAAALANSVPANTVPANAVLPNTGQANTAQASTVLPNTVQANATLANTLLANAVQANTVQANTAQATTISATTVPEHLAQANAAPGRAGGMSFSMTGQGASAVAAGLAGAAPPPGQAVAAGVPAATETGTAAVVPGTAAGSAAPGNPAPANPAKAVQGATVAGVPQERAHGMAPTRQAADAEPAVTEPAVAGEISAPQTLSKATVQTAVHGSMAAPVSLTVPVPAPLATAVPVATHAALPAPPPLAEQLARPLFTLATAPQGEHVMKIDVVPDALGPVTVRAHLGVDGIRIELMSASDSGREGLRAILADLRRDLAAGGMQTSLSLGGGNASPHQGNGQPGQSGRQASGTPWASPAPETGTPHRAKAAALSAADNSLDITV